MAAVCAAAVCSRQMSRSAGSKLPSIYRRAFTSSTSLRASESGSGSSIRDSLLSSDKSSSKPTAPSKAPETTPALQRAKQQSGPTIKRGSLGSSSIFGEEEELTAPITTEGRMPKRRARSLEDGDDGAFQKPALAERDRTNMDRALNPRPNARARWERKMVIRTIRRRGRLTKTETRMQTERESLTKSQFIKTSVKKLGPLARQIAGKNIDEAILQMRFSKKKAAKDVKAVLEQAKNEAILAHGMGMGQIAAEAMKEAGVSPEASFQPIEIKRKDGSRKTIKDPTSIYIAQTWVGRGPFGFEPEYRAKGVVNILRPPHTSITVLLKEEKTRLREWKDRDAKAQRQRKSKLWVHLPDRKISAQRQYYSW
ncbi:hypothetical protein AJ80_02319 [Polytolypa hystricis UAMH7299]|uniref:Ribosomal protein L22 n=1 Tax=Polytolypa hystricis (strain UAMH7299) TaxID=1447883 RepID=A0A2B7YR78_POLH7|nr:hypothetical protein AJ80_02319 [Polytolypa hystricis UAMH7299]